MHLEIGSS